MMKAANRIMNEGLHPLIPSEAPEHFQHLLKDCWQLSPSQRPSFKLRGCGFYPFHQSTSCSNSFRVCQCSRRLLLYIPTGRRTFTVTSLWNLRSDIVEQESI